MTAVRFHLTAADVALAGTPLVVSTHPADERGCQSFVARIGYPEVVAADGAQCGFAVLLPSGRTVTASVVLGDRPQPVDLNLDLHGDAHSLFTTAGSRVWGSFADATYHDCWIRLWRRDDRGKWEVEPWPTAPVETAPDRITFRLALPPGQHMVQTGGEGLIPKLSVVPPAGHVEVTIRPATGPVPWLATFITTDDVVAEALCGYLACGAVSAAQQVAEAVPGVPSWSNRTARDYLRRRGVPNQSRAIPGTEGVVTADEAVIRGWRLLEAGDAAAKETVRLMFGQAVEAGPPTYPEGLRLLASGLRRLADPAAAILLGLLNPVLDAADLGEPTTAFAGIAPDQPSATANSSACSTLPYPCELRAVRADPDRTEPKVGIQALNAAHEDILDAEDVLSDVSHWQLTPDRWERVGAELTRLRAMLLNADLREFLRSIGEVEVLGPTRGRSLTPSPVPVPATVRNLIERLAELLASVRSGGSSR